MKNEEDKQQVGVATRPTVRPTVFVSHLPMRRDRLTGTMSPTVDLSPADKHGDVRILVQHDASFFATADLVAELRAGLKSYNYDRGDAVIALGDPAIIACVGAVLAAITRRFTVLKWDGSLREYIRIEVAL